MGQLRNAKCLKMFVAESMSGKARDLLKREGIIAATTGSLFGRDFAQALGALTRFFAGFMSGSSIDAARLDALLSAFGDIKGAALQIRGTLFELASVLLGMMLVFDCAELKLFQGPDMRGSFQFWRVDCMGDAASDVGSAGVTGG